MDENNASNGLPELRIVASTGSTNDDVMALGRAGAPHGSCVASHEQTEGRGRRGHVWGSPSTGLYLSILMRPNVPMSHFMGLSAVCGLGVLDALHSLGATRAALKWPNDVVVPELGEDGEPLESGAARKLCGMLMEAGTGEGGMFAVAGIGVNLMLPKLGGNLGSVNPLKPAQLSDAVGADDEGNPLPVPGFDELAHAIRNHVIARCDAWAAEVNAGRAVAGPLAPILSDYFDSLPLMGKHVRVVYPNGNVMGLGTFVAVDVWGRATVKMGNGKEVTISSEQASLRPL
ncbi:biotin--[acetyl-CoA-carboxylase] ligase [Olsenella uli]|uniref:biotin--[acetyl-CoA-carboxylase] ligase n=1 Tax=Olsenella uli TaxID=133926 RepID=UPI0012AB9D22|nr:biotin--[acetyl-CoA-carboxylase] ligase [Olsenella uli]